MSGALGLLLAAGEDSMVLVGTSTGAGTGESLTLAKPSDVSPGDLLIALIADTGGSSWSGTGWTPMARHSGTLPGMRLVRKIAGGAEPSSYAFTGELDLPGSGVSVKSSGAIIAYRKAAFDKTGAIVTASFGDEIDASGITSAGGIVLAAYVNPSSGRTFTTPWGMLPLVSDSDSNGPSFAVFSQALGAGATGTRSSTPSGGGTSLGIIFGIKGA